MPACFRVPQHAALIAQVDCQCRVVPQTRSHAGAPACSGHFACCSSTRCPSQTPFTSLLLSACPASQPLASNLTSYLILSTTFAADGERGAFVCYLTGLACTLGLLAQVCCAAARCWRRQSSCPLCMQNIPTPSQPALPDERFGRASSRCACRTQAQTLPAVFSPALLHAGTLAACCAFRRVLACAAAGSRVRGR